jgi:hypothetical protein
MASLLCSRAAVACAGAPLRARSSASTPPLRRASRRGAGAVTAAAAVPLHVEYCQA